VVSVTDTHGRVLGFLDRRCYFSFHIAPQLYSEAEWTPFQTHYFSENLVAQGIEHGPLDLYPGTLTTRPQRQSPVFYINVYKFILYLSGNTTLLSSVARNSDH
jgi:hypothetical protein